MKFNPYEFFASNPNPLLLPSRHMWNSRLVSAKTLHITPSKICKKKFTTQLDLNQYTVFILLEPENKKISSLSTCALRFVLQTVDSKLLKIQEMDQSVHYSACKTSSRLRQCCCPARKNKILAFWCTGSRMDARIGNYAQTNGSMDGYRFRSFCLLIRRSPQRKQIHTTQPL